MFAKSLMQRHHADSTAADLIAWTKAPLRDLLESTPPPAPEEDSIKSHGNPMAVEVMSLR